jgi:hypothetical protein
MDRVRWALLDAMLARLATQSLEASLNSWKYPLLTGRPRALNLCSEFDHRSTA